MAELDRSARQKITLNFLESDPAADGLAVGMKTTLDETTAEARIAESQIVSSGKLLTRPCGIKSPGETALTRQAMATTEDLYEEVGKRVGVGATEKELAEYLHSRLREMGLGTSWDWNMNPIVNTGPESPIGHAGPAISRFSQDILCISISGSNKQAFAPVFNACGMVWARGRASRPTL